MKIALCLITWNEIDGVRHDVPMIDRSKFDQIYCIDGGSTDGTVEYLKESGIPVLKDIPWIGKCLFGSVSTKEVRSELLVFITPHVLDGAPTISPTTPNSHCP